MVIANRMDAMWTSRVSELDLHAGAVGRSAADLHRLADTVAHRLQTMVWKGPAADRFERTALAHQAHTTGVADDLRELSRWISTLAGEVARLGQRIAGAERAVVDGLSRGAHIPDAVWRGVGLVPGVYPPAGSPDWLPLQAGLVPASRSGPGTGRASTVAR